jgi:DNA-directed RNA polymerase subunit RPC12/RpoP
VQYRLNSQITWDWCDIHSLRIVLRLRGRYSRARNRSEPTLSIHSITMSTPPSDTTRPQRRLSTLFCECGHESPAHDGDWITTKIGKTERYRCPNCSTVILEQSYPHRPSRMMPDITQLYPKWNDLLQTWTDSWENTNILTPFPAMKREANRSSSSGQCRP